ncbi:tetratricopeptide repeat protein [uncultured Actinobacillus sp.]|uniref:tetratricopeptide repeat protein n=1 Tax=uncultured Actinobacillus sp. TaxID=417616 RepID=UPI0025DFC617|nr:tetratricopeptide repeat protein [uncultured Actinobacillus sp.]
MKKTSRDSNGDIVEKTNNCEKYFEAIYEYLKKQGWSYSDLAKEIYNKYIDVEECKNESDEKEHIKNFTDNINKAMQRKEQDKITIHKSLSTDKIKISVKKICEILNIDIPKEITYIGDIPEYDVDAYLRFNKDTIITPTRERWSWFEEKALKEVEYYAERNKKEAITALAHYYYYCGKNGIRNPTKAREFYEKTASENDEIALYQLGIIYEYGSENIPADENKAFNYYQRLSNSNFALALNKLAYCYYEGKGVSKSLDDFFKYIEKSSEQGNLEGKLNLAYAYTNGLGIKKNVEEAINIYEEILNEDVNEYTVLIYMTLSYLYRTESSIKDINKAREYLKKSIEIQLDLIENLEESKLNIFDPIYQMMSLTPEKFINIAKNKHYDDTNTPTQPTVIKALIS